MIIFINLYNKLGKLSTGDIMHIGKCFFPAALINSSIYLKLSKTNPVLINAKKHTHIYASNLIASHICS